VAEPNDGRGLGDLLSDLGRQVSTLVRKEIDLARVEVMSSATRASRGAAIAGVGGLLVYAGLLVMLAAAVLGLIEAGLDAWIAAFVVALFVIAVGGVVAYLGVERVKTTEMAPRQTAETVKENVEFVKETMK